MAAVMERHISLAKSLDPRLLRLFKRFPPPQLSPTTKPAQAEETITTASNTSSSDPNAPSVEITAPPPTDSTQTPNTKTKINPFLPFLNPTTKNWHSPHYSLRRQSVLYKLASKYGVLPLMPIAPKHPEVKELKRMEQGLRVQGTGEGRRVKGKKWERTLRGRLEERRRAMEGMPEMVRVWKERGHGRGWRRWPK